MGGFRFDPPPEAPVYRPKPDEFDDPISFIGKIRPEAEKFGICRIIPPGGWNPPFSVDIDRFKFNPRVQPLKELEAVTRVKLMFLRELSEFWRIQGITLKLPIVERRILDLYDLQELYEQSRSARNTDLVRWRRIAVDMGFKEIRSTSTVLKGHYNRLVAPFAALKNVKDLKEKEKRVQTLKQRKCRAFSQQLMEYWRDTGHNVQWPIIGTKAVDLYGLFLAVDEESKKSLEENINWAAIARELHVDGEDEAEQNLRKCYNLFIKPFIENSNIKEANSEECCICCETTGKDMTISAVCACCKNVFHGSCVRPQLSENPRPEWHCSHCISGKLKTLQEPYGFDQAVNFYTLKEFGDMAVEFKKQHFGISPLRVPTEVVEKEYWRLLSTFDHNIRVEYGADIQDEHSRTGFPLSSKDIAEPDVEKYANSKWNLNNIPIIKSSAYSYIGNNIPGVTIPWMYIGMCFSTFCWHVEDHWSYSINYLHWGEPKTWYSVPRSSADDFEKALKSIAPQLFEGQPDLLHDLSTTVNPNILQSRGVPVYRTDQRAGEFVVTFPRAYHAGFNQGFNFAEAVNFAPADWIPIGRQCIDHYASLLHFCVFSHDELMCELAEKCPDVEKNLAKAALDDLVSSLKLETSRRRDLFDLGLTKSKRVVFETIPDDFRQCQFCKTTCFLSAVSCDSCDTKTMNCIAHFDKINCDCDVTEFVLSYRYDLNELLQLLQKLALHVNGKSS